MTLLQVCASLRSLRSLCDCDLCGQKLFSLGTRNLLPRGSILREHLELDIPRVRRHSLIHVAHVLRQRSLEDEVGLVSRILSLAALDRSLKIERHSVNNLRREN